MDGDKITNILQTLEASRNKQSIYQNLLSLRRVVADKNQFTIVLKYGGIRIVTGCLLQKNANIIDNALSILGNLCIVRECAKEVIKHDGIRILSNILKNWSQDSIICRTFRIIGNIAQFDNYASEIYKYGIVPIVVSILNKSTSKNETSDEANGKNKDAGNKISMGTQVMAVRVLRMLWESYSNRQNMLQDGVIKAVSLVLIRYTEKWTISSSKKELEKLLENVLKCLLLFSKWGTLECAQQILADGNGFKTLVTLIPMNPYSAVKCLTNLSYVATSRSDIANADAVNCIITKLKEYVEKYPNERCPTNVVSAFCLFFKHPMNCSEVKKAGGLQLILKILKNCKSRRQEYQIVNALSCFHYDQQGQEILQSNGVVKIVIDCIERNLKSRSDLNEQHIFVKRKKKTKRKLDLKLTARSEKRRRDSSPSDESLSSPKTLCSSDSIAAYMNGGRMTPPDSDSSPFSSPSCTPPLKSDYDLDDDDDSVNYSPVCSDVEQEQDIENEAMIFNSPCIEMEPESEEEYDNEKTHFECSDTQEKAIIMMLFVLSRVAYIKSNTPESSLATERSLTVLFKYLRESKHPGGRITTLLTNIVSNPDNLLYLIQFNSIQLIHSLTNLQHDFDCSLCFRLHNTGQFLMKQIAGLAESDFGKGQLYNYMQKGNQDEKRKCILNIPFIVKLKSMLYKLMDSWNGLNMLIKSFVENSDQRYKITISLHKLSCAININNPIVAIIPERICKISDKYELNPENTNTVTIKLDDGSSLAVDREFLIEQADYFKVMLTGSFKESNQEIVRLKNVSNNALQYLLNVLKIDHQKLMPQKLTSNLFTILEVIVLTDIYLLETLTDWLIRCVLQYSLTVETACDIYNWSVTSGTDFLRVETVAFILTGKMKDKERFSLLESICECGLLNEIKDDVQKLISRYLKIR